MDGVGGPGQPSCGCNIDRPGSSTYGNTILRHLELGRIRIPLFTGGLFLLLSGCSLEPVTFDRITNVRLLDREDHFVNMEADAVLYNPNNASGKVKSIDLEVYFQERRIALVSELADAKVSANSEFEVPLRMKLDMDKIQENWLETLAGIFNKRSLDLHFKGKIKLKIHGVSRNIPVDYIHTLEI